MKRHSSRASRTKALPRVEFSDLPELLRKAIILAAWDPAGWWPAQSRKVLRLVCREARDAIDLTLRKIRPVTCTEEAAALARAVAAGRFAVREMTIAGDTLTVRDIHRLCAITWEKLEKLSIFGISTPRKVMALASASAHLPALRELWLSGVGNAGLQALLQVAWPKLETLGVAFDYVGVLGATALAGAAPARLPLLRMLHLLLITPLGPAAFTVLMQTRWPRLEVFLCGINHIRAAGVAALASAGAASWLPQLRELDLGNNDLEGDLHMLLSTAWPLLEELGLSQNGISEEGAEALAAASISGKLPKLRELDLSENFIDGEAVAAVARGAWPHLRTLKLGGNDLSFPPGLAASSIAGAGSPLPPPFPALAELELDSTAFNDSDVARLLESGNGLTRLETLDLGTNDISCAGAAALAAANDTGRLPALRVLVASYSPFLSRTNSHTPFTMEALEALAASTWTRLEQLNLSWAGLGKDQTRFPGGLAAQRFPALQSLVLKGCELTDEHFGQLAAAKWPRLETLTLLGNTRITPAAVARGLHSFPALRTLKLAWKEQRLGEVDAKQLLAAWPGICLEG